MKKPHISKPFALIPSTPFALSLSKGMHAVRASFGAISQTLSDQFQSVKVMIAQSHTGQSLTPFALSRELVERTKGNSEGCY